MRSVPGQDAGAAAAVPAATEAAEEPSKKESAEESNATAVARSDAMRLCNAAFSALEIAEVARFEPTDDPWVVHRIVATRPTTIMESKLAER